MIHFPLPPEPVSFDARVRQEGLAHLREQGQDPAQTPPGRALFKMKRTMANGGERSCEYWQLAKDDLRKAYWNRCVYSCFQIEQATLASGKVVFGHAIDHFKAIRNSPAELAYEWSNLRWAWGVIDNHKGNAVIPEDHDPTRLQGDALVLTENLDGLLIVVPNPRLPQAEQARLANTVEKLGLNQSAVALARKDFYDDFIANGTTYGHEFMQERQPFVFQFIFAAP